MGFLATVPGSENKTRITTELYHRIHRADFYTKWGFLRVLLSGYSQYKSGLKMKLSEEYYRARVEETLGAANERFLEVQDAGELLIARSQPLETPYNEPEAVFFRSYNFLIPETIHIQDTARLYAYLYEKIKTDKIFSEVKDVLEDPDLQTIQAY